MAMLLRPLGALLLGAAWATTPTQPTIEDMLAAGSNTVSQTGPTSSGNTGPTSSGVSSDPNGVGSQLAAPAPAPHTDMFGRAPAAPMNPMAMMGGLLGGNKQAAPGAPAGAPAPANPIMDSLLNSVEARMPLNAKMAAKAGIKQPISQESQEIVGGIVGSFMHSASLKDSEKHCLERNLGHLTGDVVGTAEDVVKAVKAIIAGHPGKAAVGQQAQQAQAKSQGAMVSAGLDGGMKLTSLITETTSLMKNCVKGDALKMLEETGHHLIDMKYVSHRLLVSGVDIAHRLSDGIIAYENKDWHRFGQDIGIAMRKVLLSNSTRGSRLPEGVPEEAIIQETTEGLLEGFFARGVGVEITDQAAPDVDIQLDLHQCIAGNHEFFKEVWLAMWNLVAELAVDAGKHEFNNPFESGGVQGDQPKWMGEIMVAMMQVPMALSRCNIGQETQQMLMQAIKSVRYLKVHFLFPQHVITGNEATHLMAKAVQEWTNWNFKGFGQQIGIILREFVLLMYPQQYFVDSSGRLRRQLSSKPGVKVGGLTLSPTFVTLTVGGVAMSMLIALVAIRGLRTTTFAGRQDLIPHTDELDIENDIEVE